MSDDFLKRHITSFSLDGLRGRVMHIPAKTPNAREILVLYGHHSTLERWWGLVQNFADYGTVTMPDLPGFGGMDSFYKVGKSATIDEYADFIADFIAERFKPDQRLNIVGISFGFLVGTRLLQRHPELADRVDFLVSAAGFMHRSDFILSKWRYYSYLWLARIMVIPPMYIFFRYVILNQYVLRAAYSRTNNAKYKFAEVIDDPNKFKRMMDMEVVLWQSNDVRTYMKTTTELLNVDNTKTRIPLEVWHVYSKTDHFFGVDRVKQHMEQVYSRFNAAPIELTTHTLSVLADKEEAGVLMPDNLRQALTVQK